jgi:hypothetical protein
MGIEGSIHSENQVNDSSFGSHPASGNPSDNEVFLFHR